MPASFSGGDTGSQKHGLHHLLIGMLVVITAASFFGYINIRSNLSQAQEAVAQYRINEEVLSFAHLFITTVLGGTDVVDVDERLALENAIRKIDDAEVTLRWEAFVNSRTDQEATQTVVDLLSILLEKVQVVSGSETE